MRDELKIRAVQCIIWLHKTLKKTPWHTVAFGLEFAPEMFHSLFLLSKKFSFFSPATPNGLLRFDDFLFSSSKHVYSLNFIVSNDISDYEICGGIAAKKSQLSGRSHKTIKYSVFERYLKKNKQARNSGLDLYYKKIMRFNTMRFANRDAWKTIKTALERSPKNQGQKKYIMNPTNRKSSSQFLTSRIHLWSQLIL